MLGLGLSHYAPYLIYGMSFIVALCCIFYRIEIGIVFIASLLPIYSVLNEVIQSGFPFANQIVDMIVIAIIIGSISNKNLYENNALDHTPQFGIILVLVFYSFFNYLIGCSYLSEEIFDLSNPRLFHLKNYMLLPVLYLITYYKFRNLNWKYTLFVFLFLSFILMDYKFYTTFRWFKHTNYSHDNRIGGTLGFLGPNEYGSFHAIYTLFIMGIIIFDKHLWRRLAYFILICFNMYSLVYSYSRGAYVGILVGAFFISILEKRILLIPILIFLIFWKTFLPLSVQQRIEGTIVDDNSRNDTISLGGAELATAGRTEVWADAIRFFLKNPIFGTGYNSYQRLTGVDTHNVYLKCMAEQGIIGIVIYLWLYIKALRSGWDLYKMSENQLVKAFGFGFLCAVIGSIVVNFFGDRWTYIQIGGLYWIFWGMVDQENSKIKTSLCSPK